MPALMLRCPSCHKGRLYSGVLQVSDRCSNCAFPLSKHDAADGPAFFVMTVLCLLLAALAGAVEMLYAPPLWVHMVLWPVVTLVASVYLLRIVKSLLIALQYRTRKQDFTG